MRQELDPFDVRQRETTKVLCPIDLAPCHEVVALSVQKPIGLHDLITALAAPAIGIVKPYLPPRNDRFAEAPEDA